jgi:hypothetical protein
MVSTGEQSFAVDFSGACGADALLILGGKAVPDPKEAGKPADKSKTTKITAGSNSFLLMTLSAAGKHPEPKADGDRTVLGDQIVRLEGNQLVLAK